MAEEEKKKSFWETLPGIITAIAALITAIAALVAAMNSGSKDGAAKPDAPAAAAPPQSSAPPANDEAAELKRKLSEIAAAKAKAEAEAAAAKARAEEAERHAAELERPQQGDIKVDDVTGMEFVYVPGGCFQMGSPESEQGRSDDEKLHEVCVDGFWMGKHEVTQGQWKKVMGRNPSKFKGDTLPVENVPYEEDKDSPGDVKHFIEKLNSKSGKKYRLPTEAEWEYACRANSPGTYCGGNDLNAVAWYSESSTHPVGEKKGNAFGLYDMSGNVWEWCADLYDSGYYAASPQNNPLNSDIGSFRVIRGGSWFNAPEAVRAAYRGKNAPDNRYDFFGFRLLLPGQTGR